MTGDYKAGMRIDKCIYTLEDDEWLEPRISSRFRLTKEVDAIRRNQTEAVNWREAYRVNVGDVQDAHAQLQAAE